MCVNMCVREREREAEEEEKRFYSPFGGNGAYWTEREKSTGEQKARRLTEMRRGRGGLRKRVS
jgi:hypothetical protein